MGTVCKNNVNFLGKIFFKSYKYLITLLTIILFVINNCGEPQKELINNSIITSLPDNGEYESIIYNTFKTGIDNYVFEFFLVTSTLKSRIKIQSIYLNDANLTNFKFQFQIKGDTVFIYSNYPIVCKKDHFQDKDLFIKWVSP